MDTGPNLIVESEFVFTTIGHRNKKDVEDKLKLPVEYGFVIGIPVSIVSEMNNEEIIVVCPRCKNKREAKISNLSIAGHSFCKTCNEKRSYDAMLGHKYGRLKVIEFGDDIRQGKANIPTFICQCECGTIKDIVCADVRKGAIKSCGCLRVEQLRNDALSDDDRAENKYQRVTPEQRFWRKKVFVRDKYTCRCCSSKGIKLAAHHLNSFSTHPNLRTEVENGVTLCSKCHRHFHVEYMGGYRVPVTTSDFEYFLKWRG